MQPSSPQPKAAKKPKVKPRNRFGGAFSARPVLPIMALAIKQIKIPVSVRGVSGCLNRIRLKIEPMAGHSALMGTMMEPALCRPST